MSGRLARSVIKGLHSHQEKWINRMVISRAVRGVVAVAAGAARQYGPGLAAATAMQAEMAGRAAAVAVAAAVHAGLVEVGAGRTYRLVQRACPEHNDCTCPRARLGSVGAGQPGSPLPRFHAPPPVEAGSPHKVPITHQRFRRQRWPRVQSRGSGIDRVCVTLRHPHPQILRASWCCACRGLLVLKQKTQTPLESVAVERRA